jgi:cold shock CspA family protein
MARATGKVKWFSKEKGYGFIKQDDGPDVFVHHQAIEGGGFKMLYEGEPVEFEVIEEPKGLKAQNVIRLDPPAEAPRESESGGGGYSRERGGSRGGGAGGRGGGGGYGGGYGSSGRSSSDRPSRQVPQGTDRDRDSFDPLEGEDRSEL